MTIFVDTSAFFAVFDNDDSRHEAAREIWTRLVTEEATLITTNYVLVETSALFQRRFGLPALRAFYEDVVPLLSIEWVGEQLHTAAMGAVLTAARKKLSLVDCVSFQIMREQGIRAAFCFDRHFREQGFELLP
jgi:predicted nucleic acid-binding protein